MPRLGELVSLWNAAAGDGTLTLDAATLRAVLRALQAFALASAALLALLVPTAALLAKSRRESRGPRAPLPPRAASPRRDPAAELDEMVRKTNERNNYVNSIFASIEDGLLLVDAEDRIVLYNPRAESLLGLGPWVFFEAAGAARREEGVVAAVLAACRDVARSRGAERRDLQAQDGRIIDAHVVPVANKYRSSANFGSLAVLRDVTEVRRLESLRKDFVATVSHEFRTPLTLISGFMEMLLTQEGLGAANKKRAFEIVQIETERLKRLVSELLTLSEIENSLPGSADEAIDVARVVGEVAASLGSLAERKRQRLETEAPADAGTVRGNAGWLWQAVSNLVENAVKYTPEGGLIRVKAWRDGPELRVSVSDTGIGIEAAELDRIFERFYRVEKSRGSGAGGSGLGLALVKDIAGIFGGAVEVESEPGRGSTFTMILPAERGRYGQGA